MNITQIMRIRRFFYRYRKWFIDADGRYGYQCVDLIRQYCKEVYGYKMPAMASAKDASAKHFTKPLRKEIQLWVEDLKMWDIITFAPTTKNKYGHIGVVFRNTKDGIQFYDQNGIGWAGGQINGTYPKIKGNGVEVRIMKWWTRKLLRAFRYDF